MPQFDFNLHGALRLRLENATQREADLVQRQLGPISVPVEGQPDLLVEFASSLPEPPDLRFIGLNDAAFIENDGSSDFYILKGKHKSRVKVSVPFDSIGQPLTIRAERSLSSIPMLVQLVNMTLLTKGILPMHASAFTYRGKGTLVTGWAKGGKTETLLAFMACGANYVGDEWIYLVSNGPLPGPIPVTGEALPIPGSMFGIPEPIRVWKWHLDSLPQYRASLKRKDKLRLGSLSAISRSMDWLSGPGDRSRGPAAKAARRIRPVLNRQLFAHFAPHHLFGQQHIETSAILDQIFFTVSHNSDEIRVEPLDSQEVARRMLHSIMEEQSVLLAYYRKFRFAFPEKSNPWLDNLERIQSKLLVRALNDKPAYAVYHPYPVHIPRLYEALERFF